MARFKQPERKFWRFVKYKWIRHQRMVFKQERAEKLGLDICEVCGRTEEDGVYVCEWCHRCNDPFCNAGCIECRPVNFYPQPKTTCSCCGQTVH